MSGESFSVVECKECGIDLTKVPEGFDPSPYYPNDYYRQKSLRFIPLGASLMRTSKNP